MADKDFVVKNGLVVNSSLIIANSTNRKISFNTSDSEADFTVATISTLGTVTTASVVNSTSDIIQTTISHGYTNAQPVLITSTSSNPVGVSNNQIYFICVRSANTFTLHTNTSSAEAGTSNVDILNAGAGTISVQPVNIRMNSIANSTAKFSTYLYRTTNGNTSLKMQQIFNNQNLGYVEYNPISSLGSIGFGTGINEAFYISNSAVLTHFNNNIRVGNSTVNSSINSTSFSGTSNNTIYAFGKLEGALNVNNATTAYGKSEGALNVNNATTAYGKSEGALNVNNSLYLGGQPSSYYTNASNLSTGTVPNARIITGDTTTAGIVQLIDSVVNTSITLAAAANSIKQTYDSAIAANTRAASAQSAAVSAYSNSITYITSSIGTATEFVNNTTGKILSTNGVWTASDVSVLATTNSTSNVVTIDFNSAINFEITLGSNSTFANSTNGKTGQSGFIHIKQDGTGSRIITWGSTWKFAGGTKPTLTTSASASDILYYNVVSNNFVVGNLIKAVS